eukprot:1658551-Prymnesium_polylepis.1
MQAKTGGKAREWRCATRRRTPCADLCLLRCSAFICDRGLEWVFCAFYALLLRPAVAWPVINQAL